MRSYREFVIETVRDHQEAAEYLQSSLGEYEKDGDLEAFLIAIRTVAEARGGISALAKKTALNRQTLYRTLSREGNPRLKTLTAILESLGFRLLVKPILP